MASWEVGDTWVPEVTVRDAGALAAPATVTLRARNPAGVVTVVPTTNPSLGVYRGEILLNAAGVWVAEFATTGPAQTQGMSITVAAATIDFVPRSLSLDAFKRRLDRELVTDDDKLRDYLLSAVMQAQAPPPYGCGRLLIPDPPLPTDPVVSRTVLVRRGRASVPDASTLTSVTVDGTVVLSSTYKTLVKDNYIVQLRTLDTDITSPYAQWAWPLEEKEAILTGRFGFQTIPANLADAIYVLAGRYLYEEAVLYADRIEVLEGTAVQSYYRQLPVRTKLVFQTYAVPAGAVALA